MLGTSAKVKITSVGRWSVFGEVIEILNQKNEQGSCERNREVYSSCSNLDSCACSKEPASCAGGTTDCCGQVQLKQRTSSMPMTDQSGQNLIRWLLRKRKNYSYVMEDAVVPEDKGKRSNDTVPVLEWSSVDKALLGGIIVSLLTILALFLYLGSKKF